MISMRLKLKRLSCLALAVALILGTMGAAFAAEPYLIHIDEKDVVGLNNTFHWWEIHGVDVKTFEEIIGEYITDPSNGNSGESRPNRTFNIVLSENTDDDGIVYIKFSIDDPYKYAPMPNTADGKSKPLNNFFDVMDSIELSPYKGIPVQLVDGIADKTFIVFYT